MFNSHLKLHRKSNLSAAPRKQTYLPPPVPSLTWRIPGFESFTLSDSNLKNSIVPQISSSDVQVKIQSARPAGNLVKHRMKIQSARPSGTLVENRASLVSGTSNLTPSEEQYSPSSFAGSYIQRKIQSARPSGNFVDMTPHAEQFSPASVRNIFSSSADGQELVMIVRKDSALAKFEQLLRCDKAVVDWSTSRTDDDTAIVRYCPPSDTVGLPDTYQNGVIAKVPASSAPLNGLHSYFTVTVEDISLSAPWDTGANVAVIYLPALFRISVQKNINVFTAGFRPTTARVGTAGSACCEMLGTIPLRVQYQNREPVEVLFMVSTNASDIDCILGTNCTEQFGFVVYDTNEKKPLHFDLATDGYASLRVLQNPRAAMENDGSVNAAHEFDAASYRQDISQQGFGSGDMTPIGPMAQPVIQAHSFSPFSANSEGYTSAFEDYQRQYGDNTLRRQQELAQNLDSAMSGGQNNSRIFRPIPLRQRSQAATPIVPQQQPQPQMYPPLSHSPLVQQQGVVSQQHNVSIVPSAPPQYRSHAATPIASHQPPQQHMYPQLNYGHTAQQQSVTVQQTTPGIAPSAPPQSCTPSWPLPQTQAQQQQLQNRVAFAGTPYNTVYSPAQSATQQNALPHTFAAPPGFAFPPRYAPQQVQNLDNSAQDAGFPALSYSMPGMTVAAGASAPPPPPPHNGSSYPVVAQQQPSPQQVGYVYGYPPTAAVQGSANQLGPYYSPSAVAFPVVQSSPASTGGGSTTTDLLLYTTTAAQLKEFNGDAGMSKALDYFDNFEGLTDGWPEDKKLRLLRMKMTGTAKIALQNYVASHSLHRYEEAKQRILETVSGMDFRPNEAWRELRHLQQKNGETLAQLGQRVLRLVRDAMGGHVDPTGLDRMCAKYFVSGIQDQQLRGFLAPLEDSVSFAKLISQAVNIHSSLRGSHGADQKPLPHRSNQSDQAVPSTEHVADEQRLAFQIAPKKNKNFRPTANANQAPLGNNSPMGNAIGNFAPAGTNQHRSNSFVPAERNANQRVAFAGQTPNGQQPSDQGGRSAFGMAMGKPAATEMDDESTDYINNCSLDAFEKLLSCDGDVVKWAQDANVGGGHLLKYSPPADTTGLPDVYAKGVLASILPSEEPFVGKRSLIRVLVEGIDARALADTGANVSVLSTDFLLRLASIKNVNVFTLGFMNSEAHVLAADGKLCAIMGSVVLEVQYKDRCPVKVCFQVSRDKNSNDCVLGTNCLGQLGFVMYDTFEQKPLEFSPDLWRPLKDVYTAELKKSVVVPPYSMMFVEAIVRETDSKITRETTVLASSLVPLSVTAPLREPTTMANENESDNGDQQQLHDTDGTSPPPPPPQITLEDQLTMLRTTGECRIGINNMSNEPLVVAARAPLASLSFPEVRSLGSLTTSLSSPCENTSSELLFTDQPDATETSVPDPAEQHRLRDVIDSLATHFKHLDACQQEQLVSLISEFSDRFALKDSDLTQTHLVEHEIDTGSEKPVKVPLRTHPYVKRLFIAESVKKLLDLKLIRPSKSPWSSPVHPVPKDDSWRFCVDFREVNKRTHVDAFPAANIEGLLSQLNGKKYFTVCDLMSGYWQIKMAPDSIEKTAFTVENGHYEWLVLPFGCCNAGATFQRFMESLFSDMLNDSVYCYVDDLGIASDSWDEHLGHLRKVFMRLRYANLRLKAKKCRIAQTSVKFLGHIVSADGVSMDSDKIRSVVEYPQPTNLKQLLRFLGMAGYYRRFLKDYSKKARPLHSLTEKDAKFVFNEECVAAFEELKRLIAYDVTLAFPDFEAAIHDPKRGFFIETDGSREGIGAVLSQKDAATGLRPIYFASRSLKKSEKNYSATELEALAIRFACYKFANYITGIPTTIITDHQALIPMFRQPSSNSRVDLWARELACRFPIKVIYRAGHANKCADALSRDLPPMGSDDDASTDEDNWLSIGAIAASILQRCPRLSEALAEVRALVPGDDNVEIEAPDDPSEFDKDSWNRHFEEDPVLCQVLVFLRTHSLPENKQEAQRVVALSGHYQLLENMLFHVDSEGNFVLAIPPAFRKLLIDERHSGRFGGHLCGRKIFKQLKVEYYWPTMRADCEKAVRECLVCAANRIPRSNRPPLNPIVTSEVMELICIDTLKIGMSASGNQYVIVAKDHFSGFAFTKAVPKKDKHEVAQFLIEDVILKHGVMNRLHSDMGGEYVNGVLQKTAEMLGIVLTTTSGYDPRCNGAAERLNGDLLSGLRKTVVLPTEWDKQLAFITFVHNTTPNEATGLAPFQIFYGKEVKFPSVLHLPRVNPAYVGDTEDYYLQTALRFKEIEAQVRENLEKARNEYKRLYDARYKVHPNKYAIGDRVMVFHPRVLAASRIPKLTWPYYGPYSIINLSPSSAEIQPVDRPEMTSEWVPIDRLCPCPSELGNRSILPKQPRKKLLSTPTTKPRPATRYNLCSSENGAEQMISFSASSLDITPNVPTGWGLFEKCTSDSSDHSTCTPKKVAEICRGASLEGEPKIETVAQHAIASAIVKKLPPALAAKVIEEMLHREDPLTWLDGQQQCFPDRIHVSPAYFEGALLARLTSCNAARQVLQASACLPIRLKGYAIDDGLKERLAELLEELRSQQFNGNKKVIQQKMVVIGDRNAEELATAITGARVLGNSAQAVVGQLFDVILGGSVRMAIIVIGRDDIYKGTPLDQVLGSVKAILEILAEFKHVHLFVLPPPWMPLYAAEYRALIPAMHILTGSSDNVSLGEYEWSDEVKKVLETPPQGNFVFLHRYKGRDFVEMSRWGTGHDNKWSDGNGRLTSGAILAIVDVLQGILGVNGLTLGSRKDALGGQARAPGGANSRGSEKRTYWSSGFRKDKDRKRDRRNEEQH